MSIFIGTGLWCAEITFKLPSAGFGTIVRQLWPSVWSKVLIKLSFRRYLHPDVSLLQLFYGENRGLPVLVTVSLQSLCSFMCFCLQGSCLSSCMPYIHIGLNAPQEACPRPWTVGRHRCHPDPLLCLGTSCSCRHSWRFHCVLLLLPTLIYLWHTHPSTPLTVTLSILHALPCSLPKKATFPLIQHFLIDPERERESCEWESI